MSASTYPTSLQQRSSFSLLPTPLHRLNNISKLLEINIYCKRDDLTGFAFGGNKTRKLDYLLTDAAAQKADTIIAVGAFQSNFCRIAAAAGIVKGYDVHLVLGGIKRPSNTGNYLLDQMCGATIHHVTSLNWDEWEAQALKLEQQLTVEGKKVYMMPIGGSTPVGALGYVNAFCEIMEDALRLKVLFDVMVHATSSGGTQAGLLVGKGLTNWDGDIMGVGVTKHSSVLQEEVYEIASKTANAFNVKIHRPDIFIDETHQGEGYGRRTDAADEAIELFARTEGILLDHVYTGKAAAALIDYCRKGRFEKDQNILFIHTGGNVELFA